MRDLNRQTPRTVNLAESGTRVIITRHGTPVAILLSVPELVAIIDPPPLTRPMPTVAAIRARLRDLLGVAFGDERVARLRERQIDRMLHKHWFWG